jgi:hypothetical protein
MNLAAILCKAAFSFVMSVCPSVRMEQFGFCETDFHEILCMRIVSQSAEKIQVLLKISRNSVIPVVRVRTLESVGSQTQLCH